MRDGQLIEREGRNDKEFHFQNWFKGRLQQIGENFDEPGRNTYPDFRFVRHPEGYELKALAYPGREADYDCNSQLPRVSTMGGKSSMSSDAIRITPMATATRSLIWWYVTAVF